MWDLLLLLFLVVVVVGGWSVSSWTLVE